MPGGSGRVASVAVLGGSVRVGFCCGVLVALGECFLRLCWWCWWSGFCSGVFVAVGSGLLRLYVGGVARVAFEAVCWWRLEWLLWRCWVVSFWGCVGSVRVGF